MTIRILPRLAAVLAAAVLAHGGGAVAAPISVCIDDASPTAALDAKLAHAIAAAEGTTARVEHYDGTGGERGYRLRNYLELVGDTCDFVLGFPIAGQDGLPSGVRATRPYAKTGFVLVTRDAKTSSKLDALPARTRVGVAFNTTPNLWFDRHPQLVRSIFETDAETLAALDAGDVDAVMLWRPSVAPLLADARHADVRVLPLDEPGARFDLVALYGTRGEAQVDAFDKAVERLRGDGELARILGAHADAGLGVEARAARLAFARRTAPTATATTPRVTVSDADAVACADDAKAKPKPKKGKGPPELFTTQQAELGKKTYDDKCAFCHAPDLNGRAGPALRGKFFASPSHNYKLKDIFKIVAENMPATAPGSLTHDEYVQIMAYILLNNGYPAGDAAMTFDGISASKVPLRFYAE